MNLLTDVNIHVALHESKGYALFLGLLPVVSLWAVPGLSVGLATTLIALGMVYAGCVLFRHFREVNLSILLVLMPYLGYVFYIGPGEARLLSIAIFLHLAAISTGAVCMQRLRSVLETIAMAAAVLTILQQLLFIATGLKTQFLLNAFLIPAHQMPMHDSLFSAVMSDGMYRPSAFFEEPSHMAQYCILGLASCLLHPVPALRRALLISAGLMACTSGMGMVLTFAIWGWWGLSHMQGRSLFQKMSIFVGSAAAAIVLFAVLYQIPFFENIFNRFMGTSETGYNAIHGRTFGWDAFFTKKTFAELLWGGGPDSLPKMYLTGFMRQLCLYGWVGVTLLFLFLGRLIIGLKGLPAVIAICFTSLYFIAGVSGFIPFIFYVGCILTFHFAQTHHEDEEKDEEEDDEKEDDGKKECMEKDNASKPHML